MSAIRDLSLLQERPRRIVIISHSRPDGDAVGSSLGLYHVLRHQGHEVSVVLPNAFPEFFNWLPGSGQIIDFQLSPAAAGDALDQAEYIFCLDFNVPARLESMSQRFLKTSATRVMIDHHRDPDNFCRYQWHDIAASSTAELIYTFLAELDWLGLLDAEAAVCLYTGVLTDTGSFRFSNTSPQTMRVTAALMEFGLDAEQIYERVYHTFSEDRMRFFGHCLVNKMQIFHQYKTGLIVVNQEELNRFNVGTGDTEGLVNYPLSIYGIVFAVLVIDRGNLRKLSFRSKGQFNVDQFARDHFSGGGHRNASGGFSSQGLDAVVRRFSSLLPNYPELNENNDTPEADRPDQAAVSGLT